MENRKNSEERTSDQNQHTIYTLDQGEGFPNKSTKKSIPITISKVRQLLQEAEDAKSEDEFLDALMRLGQRLLREFFSDAIDLYMDGGSYAGERKKQLERYKREILNRVDVEENSAETLLKALYLASQDKWMEHKGIKGRERLDPLEKKALLQLKPGDRKVKLIETYLDGEKKLLEVLRIMVKHEKYFGQAWENLTIDQLKKLLELHDVTLFLPETINKLIEIGHAASPEDKDKLVELILATYQYISKYLLGGISALYFTLGRLDLAKEVRNQQEAMLDQRDGRGKHADIAGNASSELGSEYIGYHEEESGIASDHPRSDFPA